MLESIILYQWLLGLLVDVLHIILCLLQVQSLYHTKKEQFWYRYSTISIITQMQFSKKNLGKKTYHCPIIFHNANVTNTDLFWHFCKDYIMYAFDPLELIPLFITSKLPVSHAIKMEIMSDKTPINYV